MFVVARVSGKVTDKNSNEDVANCFVSAYTVLWDYQGGDQTDSNGDYEFDLIDPNIIVGKLKAVHSHYKLYKGSFASNILNNIKLKKK